MIPRAAHLLLLAAASVSVAQAPVESTSPATSIAAGVPLHIQVTRTTHLHRGAAVEGLLTDAIYVGDRVVLPENSLVFGTVTSYAPVPRQERAQALLNADFTPLHAPVISFTRLHLVASNTDIALNSTALIRQTNFVRFVPREKKPSLLKQGETMVRDQVKSTYDTLFGPGRKDRALQFVYGQLPYHPQRIWKGTLLIADLNAPASVDLRRKHLQMSPRIPVSMVYAWKPGSPTQSTPRLRTKATRCMPS